MINKKKVLTIVVFSIFMFFLIIAKNYAIDSLFNSESKAKKLGFSSLAEYKEYKARGFKNMEEVTSAAAIKPENVYQMCSSSEKCLGKRVTWRGWIQTIKNDEVTVRLLSSKGHHHDITGDATLLNFKGADRLDKKRIIYFDGTLKSTSAFSGYKLTHASLFRLESDAEVDARKNLQAKWERAADAEEKRCQESAASRDAVYGNYRVPLTSGDYAHNLLVDSHMAKTRNENSNLNNSCRRLVEKMRNGEYQD